MFAILTALRSFDRLSIDSRRMRASGTAGGHVETRVSEPASFAEQVMVLADLKGEGLIPDIGVSNVTATQVAFIAWTSVLRNWAVRQSEHVAHDAAKRSRIACR